jgi:hypothetical protein
MIWIKVPEFQLQQSPRHFAAGAASLNRIASSHGLFRFAEE